MPPPASIVIPTRARPDYLEVALTSIRPEADDAEAEVLVIDDAGPSPERRALVERLGARYEPHPGPLGLNFARNTGVECSSGELVVFVDDDVRVLPGWLRALLHAAREHADVDVFTGPVEPCLEGGGRGRDGGRDGGRGRGRGGDGSAWGRIHACGREGPPITSLQLGKRDVDTRYAWGANMAIRRSALRRVGPFEVALEYGGDEQEWQDRLRAGAPDARVLYVAGAALEHRRAGADARLRSLARAAYARGRASRRFDSFRGEGGGRVPSLGRELLTLGGCLGHVLRRRCPAGLVSVAHSAGRLREGLRGQHESPLEQRENPWKQHEHQWEQHERSRGQPDAHSPEESAAYFEIANSTNGSHAEDAHPPDDFLSGESGAVGGIDAIRRGVHDEAVNAWELASGRRLRLGIAARRDPPRRKVLVLGVERPEHRALAKGIRDELLRSRHEVELHFDWREDLGKFENLNKLLIRLQLRAIDAGRVEDPALDDYDWLLVVDDDIHLPRGFLDRFLFLAERFSLDLAQPAHRLRSHAAWSVTRRRMFSVVRETPFVEIGPVTALARPAFLWLLPFPEMSMGWGLDAHWAALARKHGLRCGVLDAVSISHRAAPAASAYSREEALEEARGFLAYHPYLPADELQRTLVTHRRWR